MYSKGVVISQLIFSCKVILAPSALLCLKYILVINYNVLYKCDAIFENQDLICRYEGRTAFKVHGRNGGVLRPSTILQEHQIILVLYRNGVWMFESNTNISKAPSMESVIQKIPLERIPRIIVESCILHNLALSNDPYEGNAIEIDVSPTDTGVSESDLPDHHVDRDVTEGKRRRIELIRLYENLKRTDEIEESEAEAIKVDIGEEPGTSGSYYGLKVDLEKKIVEAINLIDDVTKSKDYSEETFKDTMKFCLECTSICLGNHASVKHLSEKDGMGLQKEIVQSLVELDIASSLIPLLVDLVDTELLSHTPLKALMNESVMLTISRTIRNLSTISFLFCQTILNSELLVQMHNVLCKLYDDHINEKLESSVETFIHHCLLILYNCCSHDDVTVIEEMLDAKIDCAVKPYVDSCHEKILIVALLLTIQLTTTEEEAETCIHNKVLYYLLKTLKLAMNSTDRIYSGYSVVGILKGILKASAMDVNKRRLFKLDANNLITRLLKSRDVEEKTLAVKILKQLSFNSKNAMLMKKRRLSETLQSITLTEGSELLHESKALSISIKAEGDEKQRIKLISQLVDSTPRIMPHIMVSYHWDHQEVVMKIVDALRQEGYKVWFDKDCMNQDLYQAMAEAIENSWVVLICMSLNYKNSSNCRNEATYATDKKKKVIPLRMDKHEPNGWLALLTCGLIYHDFSGTFPFDEKLRELLAAINKFAKEDKIKTIANKRNEDSQNILEWKEKDVKSWFIRNNITWTDRLSMNGKDLHTIARTIKELKSLHQVDMFIEAISKL